MTPIATAPAIASHVGMRARVTPSILPCAPSAPGRVLTWSVPSSPRSRDLLSWLPAAILLVVIAGVVFATIAVQNSWWTDERPVASDDQRASDGGSRFSDAGLDYVNVDGVLRVRVGEGSLPAAESGLGDDEQKTATMRRPVRAIVAVGADTFVVREVEWLQATAQHAELRSVALSTGRPLPWADAVALVRASAAEYGWDAADIDAQEALLEEFVRENDEGSFTLEVSSERHGVEITATLTFDRGSGSTTLVQTFDAG